MIVGQALVDAITRLTPKLGSEARIDASILLAHALNISRAGLIVAKEDVMTPDQITVFGHMIDQRVLHQPVAQIIGSREFWGLDFIVTQDVLDPRADTETLVEAALAGKPTKRILDLGTGTGCILLSILHERPDVMGVGVDISTSALDVARRNAQNLNLSDRADFRLGNWFEGLSDSYDLITANPPYISQSEMADLDADVANWEPHLALTPGGDGLDPYRIIAAQGADYLTPNGRLLVEFGWTQAESVRAILAGQNWKNIHVLKDLGGNDRVISASR